MWFATAYAFVIFSAESIIGTRAKYICVPWQSVVEILYMSRGYSMEIGREYLLLFNAVTDVIDGLEAAMEQLGDALNTLKDAQCRAEEIYINNPYDDECEEDGQDGTEEKREIQCPAP